MLMTVATIAFRSINTNGTRLFAIPVILALNVFGAVLDCVTIVMVIRQNHKAIRVLAYTHTILLFLIGQGSIIAIAIIRILLISFLSRVRHRPSPATTPQSVPSHTLSRGPAISTRACQSTPTSGPPGLLTVAPWQQEPGWMEAASCFHPSSRLGSPNPRNADTIAHSLRFPPCASPGMKTRGLTLRIPLDSEHNST